MKNIVFLIIIFLTLVLFPKLSDAQAFGYQGKKLLVGGTFGFSPSLISILNGDDEFQFNKAFGITVEYAHYKTVSFGFNMNFFNTGIYRTPTISRHIQGDAYYFKPENELRMNSREIDFFLRKYYRVSAPLGMFFGISYGRQSFNYENRYVMYTNDKLTAPDNEYKVHFDENIKTYYLGLEHGVQRVITDKLLIKFSASFRFNGHFVGELSYVDNPTNHEYVEKEMKNKIGRHSLLRFELGLGYLIL